jgi:type IV secretory pathway VirJ component
MVAILLVLTIGSCSLLFAEDNVTVPPFGIVHTYEPVSRPESFVILVSGDGGWVHAVVDLASKLSAGKTFVAGIDIRQYLDGVKKSSQGCLNAGKDFQNLTATLRAKYSLSPAIQPALVGYSSGATLVYAAIAQSSDTFSGAVSFGFCPDFEYSKPFCNGQSLVTSKMPGGRGVYLLPDKNLRIPWIVFQGSTDQVCNPRVTKDFVQQVPSGEFIFLNRVGHGFADERKWLPQFRHSFLQLHPIGKPRVAT